MSFSVLVLDDDHWQLSWMRDLAKSFGGTCHFASTYEEAKFHLDAQNPALAIVDIRIGDVDEPLVGATLKGANPDWVGLRFLNYVRVEKKSAKTKLFVYTGLDREDLRKTVEGAYAAEFFTKFEPERFQNRLIAELKRLKNDPALK